MPKYVSADAKRRSRLPNDTLIGVFLALTLGLGLCLLLTGIFFAKPFVSTTSRAPR